MSDDPVHTGFEDVLAGEVYEAPDLSSLPVQLGPFAELDGAVTATVTPPPPPDVAAIQAMKALVHMPDMTPHAIAKLAMQVAMDIKERHDILKDAVLTQAQFDFLESTNDFYKNAYHNACLEWHAPLSTQERIKVEAAAILEDSLLELGARMRTRAEGLPGVVEAAKLFAKIAGVGEPEARTSSPGERFTINIDLGADQKIALSASPAPQQIAEPDRSLAPPSFIKAPGSGS
jgi:hypothetical protein